MSEQVNKTREYARIYSMTISLTYLIDFLFVDSNNEKKENDESIFNANDILMLHILFTYKNY